MTGVASTGYGTGEQIILSRAVDSSGAEAVRIRPFHLEILPPSSGVQFYRDGIIFLSHSATEEKVPGTHLSFGSIRTYSSLIADTLPGTLMPFSFPDNALFPTEATTFSSDYKTMYLSLIPERNYGEKIFRASYTPSGWKLDENPVEFCNDYNIYAHPCLSHDGTFMIFSSDMNTSEGGLDLFITRREGDKWSTPVNLGKEVNSRGNELFASLDSKNNLYFSSDGHPGKGGYDIFISRYNGNGWEKPRNLSAQINTKADELGFKIDREDDRRAFYTVRNRSGRQRTQLYIVDINPDLNAENANGLSQRLLAMAEDAGSVTAGGPVSGAEKAVASASVTSPGKIKSGKPDDKAGVIAASAVAAETAPEAKPGKEIASARTTTGENLPAKAVKDETNTARPGKDEATPAAAKPETTRPAAATPAKTETPTAQPAAATSQKPATTTAASAKADAAPAGPIPATNQAKATVPAAKADVVVYRVQITASNKAVGSQNITVAGKSYKSFEYFYMGGYRTTIGEFSVLADATRLQNLCRQNGYNQAFVVAFRNNERTNDPSLFR